MMYKHQPHNDLIEGKLRELPLVDASQLWTGMQSILDRQMPVAGQEKRRGAFWLFRKRNTGLLGLIGISVISVMALAYGYSNYSSAKNDFNISPTDETSGSVAGQNKNISSTPDNTQVETPLLSEELSVVAQSSMEGLVSAPVTVSSGDAVISDKSTAKYSSPSDAAGGQNSHFSSALNDDVNTANSYRKQSGKKSVPAANDLSGRLSTDNQTAVVSTPSENKTIHFINPSEKNTWNLPTHVDSVHQKEISVLFSQLRSLSSANTIGRRENEKGPYAGILAGLDLSSIKFSGMKTGSTKGLILGYAFNNRLSLESGLFWAQKRYYGEGQYFRPSGYTLPAGVTMLAVAGDVRLYEWPVNIRYTILPGKNRLFVTTGLSSYFMKKESYEYEYEQNGLYGKNYATYTNESRNLFSVVNFSIGYTHKLGSIGSLRVEPYWKLPLKDLGINNMPVMSAGINVGLTRKITW